MLNSLLSLFLVLALAQESDVGRDMVGIVRSKGYPLETHSVTTEDGYILGMFRIPPRKVNSPVVLLQHGLLGRLN